MTDRDWDLKLDLLVDGELSEAERAETLRRLQEREGWRELAVRFLQRQDERQTARRLLEGGRLLPMPAAALPRECKYPLGRWMRSTSVLATAAGLLIAAISATLTLYLTRPGQPQVVQTAAREEVFHGSLPGDVMGSDQAVPVEVPTLRVSHDAADGLLPANGDAAAGDRLWFYQRDGKDAVVIPVNRVVIY